jgi:hypothetical protein
LMSETEDFLISWVEEQWIVPCHAFLPRPFHGLCMFLPVFVVGGLMIGVVAIIVWCDGRAKAKKEAEAAEAAKKKTKKKN